MRVHCRQTQSPVARGQGQQQPQPSQYLLPPPPQSPRALIGPPQCPSLWTGKMQHHHWPVLTQTGAGPPSQAGPSLTCRNHDRQGSGRGRLDDFAPGPGRPLLHRRVPRQLLVPSPAQDQVVGGPRACGVPVLGRWAEVPWAWLASCNGAGGLGGGPRSGHPAGVPSAWNAFPTSHPRGNVSFLGAGSMYQARPWHTEALQC